MATAGGENTNPDFARFVGEQLAGQLDAQEQQEAATRAYQEQAGARINEAQQALLDSFLNKAKRGQQQPLPAEVLQIVQVLLAQPRLIEPTDRFLRRLAKEINDAVDQVINDILGADQEGTAANGGDGTG